jgi:putative FmdB family regulatory protein
MVISRGTLQKQGPVARNTGNEKENVLPIYEFKCMQCEEFIEILVMNSDEKVELVCPKCKGEELERVLSSTNYSMNDAPASQGSASATTRTCSSGSCTTYEIPGPTR